MQTSKDEHAPTCVHHCDELEWTAVGCGIGECLSRIWSEFDYSSHRDCPQVLRKPSLMSSTDGMMKVDGIELWELYTKSVEPLEKHRGAAKVKVRNNPAVWRTPKDVYTMFIEKRHPPSAALHVSGNPERTPIPRRLRRKFKSELTIDLHGYTRHINDTLSKFCHKCISNNIRSITIVTGKGSGVVWQAVREWLEIHIELITGFFEIRDASGGSGAYGVYLRVLRHKHR